MVARDRKNCQEQFFMSEASPKGEAQGRAEQSKCRRQFDSCGILTRSEVMGRSAQEGEKRWWPGTEKTVRNSFS